MPDSSDDGSDNIIDESFFVDTEYQLQSIQFQDDINIPYYSLYNVTTAYDLTGQILWPATHILQQYLQSESNHIISQHTNNVIELGAGIGIISILIHQLYHNITKIITTDHNLHVLQLINRNIELNQCSNIVQSYELEWGNLVQIDYMLNTLLLNGDTILVGSDLCYSVSAVALLIQTIAYTLQQLTLIKSIQHKPKFILSYILRTHTVHSTLLQSITQYNLCYESIELNTFMNQPVPNGYLFMITLA